MLRTQRFPHPTRRTPGGGELDYFVSFGSFAAKKRQKVAFLPFSPEAGRRAGG